MMNARVENSIDTFRIEQRPLEPHYRSVGWESAGGRRVEVPTTDTDEFYRQIDRDLGEKEEEASVPPLDPVVGLDIITDWLLQPVVNSFGSGAARRDLPLDRKQSAFAKVVLLKASLNPQALGLTKTTLTYLSDRCGLAPQVMGRVANDFATRFPDFVGYSGNLVAGCGRKGKELLE
jgi:hypothetical protein